MRLIPPTKRPALAGAGGYDSKAPAVYQIPQAIQPLHAARADTLREHLFFSGGKLYLTPATFAFLRRVIGMDRHDVEAAAGHLAAAGQVEMRLAGETLVIELRAEVIA